MKTFYKLNPLQLGSGIAIPDGFTEYTKGNEPQELLDALELEKQEQLKQQQIAEAKAYLDNTDYKLMQDYDGDTTGIAEARADARATIRRLTDGN